MKTKATEFDRAFDEGKDVTRLLDIGKARRPGREARRVNVDFPAWMVLALDRESARLGVTRQSLVKVWIAERLERLGRPLAATGQSDDVPVYRVSESAASPTPRQGEDAGDE